LDYPRDQMRGVIVDDGSTDDTANVALSLASSRPWAQVESLTKNVGKAQALNQSLTPLPAGASPGEQSRSGWERRIGGEEEILVIYDADHRPSSASLRALVAPFTDSNVAAVSGQMRVVNGRASPAAFYTWVESHVNQFITMRGKDRLNLAPALLGANCAYRRSAFEAVGGFRPGSLLEDSDLTLAFALAGWRTRFAPDSVSEHHAPTTLRGHVKQHLRWNRGFHQVMGGRLSALWASPLLSLWLKVELTFFALGYTDRLALLAGALFTAIDFLRPGTFGFPWWAWLIYFGIPALEMVAALVIAREPFGMFARLIYVPFFFTLDIGIALWSSVLTIARRPFRWTMTERPQVS
jgi:cellulose synthase/poly-beta-1,6-N-acetylglucosamine synthase-like glycosyltransferase